MDLKKKNSDAVEHFKAELKKLRSGRVTAQSLDHVKVDVMGAYKPLKACGQISCHDRQIVIVLYDPSSAHTIAKAIEEASSFAQVVVEKGQIRVNFSPPSKETRLETMKLASKKSEEAKITIRQHRKEMIDLLKKQKSSSEITEDQQKKGEKKAQELTDQAIKEIELALAEKEKELQEV
ncbi:MAG: ribosome-recycling factor [Chlamydiia bacterium]